MQIKDSGKGPCGSPEVSASFASLPARLNLEGILPGDGTSLLAGGGEIVEEFGESHLLIPTELKHGWMNIKRQQSPKDSKQAAFIQASGTFKAALKGQNVLEKFVGASAHAAMLAAGVIARVRGHGTTKLSVQSEYEDQFVPLWQKEIISYTVLDYNGRESSRKAGINL